MFRFLFIFTLSTIITVQTNGSQNLEKGLPIKSAYQKREVENNYVDLLNNKQGIYNYFQTEYSSDKEQGYTYEDVKVNDSQDEEGNLRRMYEWFSRLFKTTTPRNIHIITSTQSNYARELKERIFLKTLHNNLTDILFMLSEVEKRVAVAMDQREGYSIHTKSKPYVIGLDNGYFHRERFKRALEVETKAEVTNSTTDKALNDTQKVVDNFVNTTENPSEKNASNSRRAGTYLATPSEVKRKLLVYLEESFLEIQDKIQSLKNLKQAFSDNNSFKIGYIIANIDTLEINMLNLKSNMEKDKDFLDDTKILDLYDTLKVSNQAVSGMIQSLKVYLEKLNQIHAKYQPRFG